MVKKITILTDSQGHEMRYLTVRLQARKILKSTSNLSSELNILKQLDYELEISMGR